MKTTKKTTPPTKKTPTRRKRALGFRSGLEERINQELASRGVDGQYEKHKLEYVTPAKRHRYTPDFVLPNNIIVESKGYFTPADRQKHLDIRDSNPSLEIRFVFDNPSNKLRKGSKTSYADWCDKNGFKWARKSVPPAWLEEDDWPPLPIPQGNKKCN
jgi:hypothetical protein